ncbi:hypothetical protein C1H46_022335 [Malus baccata]|uniref:Uncharacterized protein n=1 Tax=Malus baccata TaxID=106549 RepID=A0A540M050_MALBA|nr:hypothetical protein C1H46_022335 [Malus baccata]
MRSSPKNSHRGNIDTISTNKLNRWCWSSKVKALDYLEVKATITLASSSKCDGMLRYFALSGRLYNEH